MQSHEGQHILFMELGVGMNTPVIIKIPFMQMTAQNPNAVFACLNCCEVFAPDEISEQSILIDGDIHDRMPLILNKENLQDWIRPNGDPSTIVEKALTNMAFEGAIEYPRFPPETIKA